MELIIDFDGIGDSSKQEWLIRTLKLMKIGFTTKGPMSLESPQSIDEYNADLEEGEAQIKRGDFITAKDLKNQISTWK